MIDLMTPDDFAGNAYGWLTNQLSHAALGLAVAGALAALLHGRASHPKAIALALLAACYGAVEAIQRGTLTDGLADWSFVMLGGLLGLAVWEQRGRVVAACLALIGVFAVAGVRKRGDRDV